MSRIEILEPESMSPAQRCVYDATFAGRRGYVPAPANVWLRSPELADRAQKLGEFVRYQTSLPPRLSELAILMTARFWKAHYEWWAHKPHALEAGLSPALIEDIAHRRSPQFENDDERIVYVFVDGLLNHHKVPEDTYNATVGSLGEKAVVELVGILGYYALISMTVNCFEIEIPDGSISELATGRRQLK
jgi:4-carboxymuconolactone decarboxylase